MSTKFDDKTKIEIVASSYVVPNEYLWGNLNLISKIFFHNMSDYASLITDKPGFVSAIILIKEDFSTGDFNQNLNLDLLESIFNLIETRLNNRTEPVILALGDGEAGLSYFNRMNYLFELRHQIFFQNKIENLISKYTNFYFLDLNKVFFDAGGMRTYSSKNFYFASCRFSSEAIKIIGNSLVNIIRQIVGKPRKLIAIDCDNTLWGGVVGETGFKNIILGSDGIGKVFTEVQKIIKHYVELGLVLTLVSKNNEQDVWEVFDNNSSMVLAKNDISLAKINWKSKVDNLIAISKELNLSLDSFIFIDDNKFERDEIRLRLPEVEVIDLPSEITDWPKELLNIRNVIQFSTSSEDRNKTYHYTIRQKFLNDISAHNDRIMFLRQVAMKPSLVPIDDHNIDRAAQISQRTNQFNLRTQRYTTSDIKKFASENNSFLVNLIDNYGDHGNIALIILRDLTPDILFVEAFMISCRVLSRDLEFWILNEIVKLSKAKKIKYIYFELKKTKKNQPVLDFFSNLGLSLLQPTELFKAQDLLLKSNILIEDSLYELNVEQFLVPRLEVFDE